MPASGRLDLNGRLKDFNSMSKDVGKDKFVATCI
jgi:hypothetical protein